jgi:hypothetical protein
MTKLLEVCEIDLRGNVKGVALWLESIWVAGAPCPGLQDRTGKHAFGVKLEVQNGGYVECTSAY